MQRRIAAVSTSRADYGHLYWVLRDLEEHPGVELTLLATAAQLAPAFGRAVDEVERDGFRVDERIECLLDADTDVGMAKTIGVATLGFADSLARLRPDLLLLIADRYELLAPAAVALALRIPIAHIEGGEVSEGAIDDAVRNALTKLAHVHFTPTESAQRRVLAMGEEPWRVHRTGAPSLDHLRRSRLPSREVLEAELGCRLGPGTIVVSCHPVTLAVDPLADAGALLEALERFRSERETVLFCFPNADAGSRELIERARAFSAHAARARVFVNLNPLAYWGLLSHADLLVGNSSSGIMETPALRLPTVNVGFRQQGRERARNVLDAPARRDAIEARMREALQPAFRESLSGLENPYGDGRAAERIVAALTDLPPAPTLLHKRPLPLDP